jgi:hypothetical protein
MEAIGEYVAGQIFVELTHAANAKGFDGRLETEPCGVYL